MRVPSSFQGLLFLFLLQSVLCFDATNIDDGTLSLGVIALLSVLSFMGLAAVAALLYTQCRGPDQSDTQSEVWGMVGVPDDDDNFLM